MSRETKECDLGAIADSLRTEPQIARLLRAVKDGESRAVRGLPAAAHAVVAAVVAQGLRGSVLVVTPYSDRAMQLSQEIQVWLGDAATAHHFPALDALPYDRTTVEPSLLQQRLSALRALGDAAPTLVVAPARALAQPLAAPDDFYGASHTYRLGDTFDLARELARWERGGYRPVESVVAPGEFARRGGIVDVYAGDAERPTRIELFGDVIDSLRPFDPGSQRSRGRVDEVTVAPTRSYLGGDRTGGVERLATERQALERLASLDRTAMLPSERLRWEEDLAQLEAGAVPESMEYLLPSLLGKTASLLSYLPAGSLLLLDESDACWEALAELFAQSRDIRDELVARGELPPGLPDALMEPAVVRDEIEVRQRLELLRSGTETRVETLEWGDERVFVPALAYAGRLRAFLDDTLDLREDRRRVVVASLQSARLRELYDERVADGRHGEAVGISGTVLAAAPETITLVQGAILEGWQAPAAGLYVFSDAEIFGWNKPAPVARFRRETGSGGGLDFKPGDYIVHIEHGIGRFNGVEKRSVGGMEREYLDLQYAGTDRLFVPTDQLDRVTRYVGMGETSPALSRLGTAEWTRTKARATESVAKVAQDLLQLYAYRKKAEGHAVAPDGTWQREMEAAFPYVETPDQRTAIEAVKRDMESTLPMDRLVCGDVGYGKTEVALRAAFKAAMDGLQVAVLVPTTILAQQHFATFSARMEAYPVRIAVLSRFQTRPELQRTLKRLERGEIDIVVGTHRLLQKDVHFKNLGLVVIDEEQRFGVKHKEFLKTLRRDVHALTLTATPIPRSLHMALVGVRDMSVIETPPEGRLPIRTYLQPFDDYHVREAIIRELDRGGQIYVVHNRVQTMQAMAERMRRLVPEARIAMAHGQMPEDEMERVIAQFTAREHDLLVCSAIIENGLDIPSVNTMIVNDAPQFGLAQLYQLRGRIGRGSVRAYAYLLYRSEEALTPTAERRLRAIFEASELGAGFQIAMKDLEIRGAGNLLGAEQSGSMMSVGFNLYSRLLAQAIDGGKRGGIRGGVDERPAASVELPFDIYIPTDYVEHQNPRLALYQRAAMARTIAEVEVLEEELRDRFGPLPLPAENLLFSARVKVLATLGGLSGVSIDDALLVLRGGEETIFDRAAVYRRFGSEAKIVRGVLRAPRRLIVGDWRPVLLQTLHETLALNGVSPSEPTHVRPVDRREAQTLR